MSSILCRWLNEEVRLSIGTVDATNFAADFADGYLFGELFAKYQLQNDFPVFQHSHHFEVRAANFTKLEPTFRLLDIPFNSRVAREIMTEQHGVAMKVVYQLRMALEKLRPLNRMQDRGMTPLALATVKGKSKAVYENMRAHVFEDVLKHNTPLKDNEVLEKFAKEQERKERAEAKRKEVEKARQEQLQRERHNQILEQFHHTQKVHGEWASEWSRVPGHQSSAKPKDRMTPQQKAQYQFQALTKKKEKEVVRRREEAKAARMQLEADAVAENLEHFERNMKRFFASPADWNPSGLTVADIRRHAEGSGETSAAMREAQRKLPPTGAMAGENLVYVSAIKERKYEELLARKERAKRRRKVMVDQQKAQVQLAEASKQEMLRNKLTQRSHQERKIAAHLMQTRHEKDVIRENRIFREKQYSDRRQKDFEEAMRREAELARVARLEYQEQAKVEEERHRMIAAERAEARYQKHYNICSEVLDGILELVTKVGEYRNLTAEKLPPQLMREWKLLFLSGKSLYGCEVPGTRLIGANNRPGPVKFGAIDVGAKSGGGGVGSESTAPAHGDPREVLLDKADLHSYLLGQDEWVVPDKVSPRSAHSNHTQGRSTLSPQQAVAPNAILSHVVHRLLDITYPPEPPPPPPKFPAFRSKVALVGKAFSGKSLAAQELARCHGLTILNIDALVEESMNCFNAAKEQGVSGDELSKVAVLGEQVLAALSEGKEVGDAVLVDLMAEAIRNINDTDGEGGGKGDESDAKKANRGWVMDGFPCTSNQAILLEKALTGYVPHSRPASIERKSSVVPGKSGGRGLRSAPKKKKSVIVPEVPDPSQEDTQPPSSGIDIVIVFDVDDKVVLKRAVGRRTDPDSNEVLHLENTPLHGSLKEPGQQGLFERLQGVSDASNDEAQILHRLASYHDEWKNLEEWFGQFRNLYSIPAHEPPAQVVEKVYDLLVRVENGEAITAAEEETKNEEDDVEDNAEIDSVSLGHSASQSLSMSITPAGKIRDESPPPDTADSTRSKRSVSAKSGRSSRASARNARSDAYSMTSMAATFKHFHLPDFVDLPLPDELAHILSAQWETIEDTYVTTLKSAFRMLRHERERTLRYFHDICQSFMRFLQRPDNKQEFVKQWQIMYNSVDEDMRDDPATKAELHRRLEDLRENLWDICDTSKREASEERACVMDEKWLEDHMGILINLFITLMQVEVDRYQDTVQLVTDYYTSMEGRVISELKENGVRIPLIELPNYGEEAVQAANGSTPKHIIPITKRSSYAVSTPGSKTRDDKSKRKEAGLQALDEQIILDSFNVAMSALVPEEEDAPHPPEGQSGDVENLVTERRAVMAWEANRFQVRLEMIKARAIEVLVDVADKADASYSKMESWLGQRYSSEMTSIDVMSELIRVNIENEERLPNELVLEGVTFVVDEKVLAFEPPPPMPAPPPAEEASPDAFTVVQIRWLCSQFHTLMPSGGGMLGTISFIEVIHQLSALSVGSDLLPEDWMHVSSSQLANIAASLNPSDPDLVDWRKFLVHLAAPWPVLSLDQLVEYYKLLKVLDPENIGVIKRSQFLSVPLWRNAEDVRPCSATGGDATKNSPMADDTLVIDTNGDSVVTTAPSTTVALESVEKQIDEVKESASGHSTPSAMPTYDRLGNLHLAVAEIFRAFALPRMNSMESIHDEECDIPAAVESKRSSILETSSEVVPEPKEEVDAAAGTSADGDGTKSVSFGETVDPVGATEEDKGYEGDDVTDGAADDKPDALAHISEENHVELGAEDEGAVVPEDDGAKDLPAACDDSDEWFVDYRTLLLNLACGVEQLEAMRKAFSVCAMVRGCPPASLRGKDESGETLDVDDDGDVGASEGAEGAAAPAASTLSEEGLKISFDILVGLLDYGVNVLALDYSGILKPNRNREAVASLFETLGLRQDEWVSWDQICAAPQGMALIESCSHFNLINVKLRSKARPESTPV